MSWIPNRREVLIRSACLTTLAALPTFGLQAGQSTRDSFSTNASTSDLPVAGGRNVAVWSWRPTRKPVGTILFSHGAASAPWKYERLFNHWLAAGYAVHAPLHVDSTDHPEHHRYPATASWPARIADMRALADRFGGRGYVAAGHSYGALLALTLGGATPIVPADVAKPLRDPLAKAVVAFSPPPPIPGLIEPAGFATLAVPALIQTGTADVPPGSNSWEGHLAAWEEPVPTGYRYALVLAGVDHYFKGAICRPELPGPPQLTELAVAARLSIEFIEAYLKRRRKVRGTFDARVGRTGSMYLHRR
jgi:pimeloyl-ACP methyl ester carboxylesterase